MIGLGAALLGVAVAVLFYVMVYGSTVLTGF